MTYFAGDKPTASQFNNPIAPGWTSYTVVWTCSTTAPAVGNGTLTGRYRRPTGSDLMTAEVRLAVGSTTTFGTGYFIFSLPANASAGSVTFTIGDSFINDVSAQGRPGSSRFNSASELIADNSAGVITGTSPMVFANGDILQLRIQYEPA